MRNVSNPEMLGKIIREKRKKQSLTQQQLAGVSGTGVRFISDLEKGKATCHIGKVFRVLEMLGITLTLGSRNKL